VVKNIEDSLIPKLFNIMGSYNSKEAITPLCHISATPNPTLTNDNSILDIYYLKLFKMQKVANGSRLNWKIVQKVGEETKRIRN